MTKINSLGGKERKLVVERVKKESKTRRKRKREKDKTKKEI